MERCSGEPGEVGLTSAEQTGERINQDRKGRLATLTARETKRQTPRHPVVAFATVSATRAFSPQHAKSQGPLGPVVGGFDAVFTQTHPPRGHLPLQTASQTTGLVRSFTIVTDQAAKACIPSLPLSTGRGCFGHVTQALQFLECPPTTGGTLGMAFFRQLPGGANQMGQTGLSTVAPGVLHLVAVRNEEAFPILDEVDKGFFGTVRMHEKQRHPLGGHGPEPLQGVVAKPRRFINRAYGGVVS